jgi:hypothetical protein
LRRILPALLTCLLFVSAADSARAAQEEPRPEVVRVGGSAKGREARVSFQLRNAFPPEMIEALKTGMEISFRYEARVERVHRAWFDETLAEVQGIRTVRYDTLARVYRLQRGGREDLLPDVRSAVDAMTRYDLVMTLDDEVLPGDRIRAFGKVHIDRVAISDALRTVLFFTRLWDVETAWSRGYLTLP